MLVLQEVHKVQDQTQWLICLLLIQERTQTCQSLRKKTKAVALVDLTQNI